MDDRADSNGVERDRGGWYYWHYLYPLLEMPVTINRIFNVISDLYEETYHI